MIKKKILKDTLWKIYEYLQDVYGLDENDILTNSAIKLLSAEEIKIKGETLKKEIRNIFEIK